MPKNGFAAKQLRNRSLRDISKKMLHHKQNRQFIHLNYKLCAVTGRAETFRMDRTLLPETSVRIRFFIWAVYWKYWIMCLVCNWCTACRFGGQLQISKSNKLCAVKMFGKWEFFGKQWIMWKLFGVSPGSTIWWQIVRHAFVQMRWHWNLLAPTYFKTSPLSVGTRCIYGGKAITLNFENAASIHSFRRRNISQTTNKKNESLRSAQLPCTSIGSRPSYHVMVSVYFDGLHQRRYAIFVGRRYCVVFMQEQLDETGRQQQKAASYASRHSHLHISAELFRRSHPGPRIGKKYMNKYDIY